MGKQNKKPGGLCAICGVAPASTDDHIPPKNIFPKPRPSDLITVRTCERCNNAASGQDEEFRVFLSLQIGAGSEITRRLWEDGALRSLKHNGRLRNHIINTSWDVRLRTPAGIDLGMRRAVPMPVRPHNAVMDRIVRGLYFHHFGEILGRRAVCRVTPLTGIPDEISSTISKMRPKSIGNGAFMYRFARAEESPLDSIWLLLFHQSYLVLVNTVPQSKSSRSIPHEDT